MLYSHYVLDLICSTLGLRAGKNALFGSQIDSKIAAFTKSFKDLRCSFTEHGVLEIEIKLAVLEGISELAISLLIDLHPESRFKA